MTKTAQTEKPKPADSQRLAAEAAELREQLQRREQEAAAARRREETSPEVLRRRAEAAALAVAKHRDEEARLRAEVAALEEELRDSPEQRLRRARAALSGAWRVYAVEVAKATWRAAFYAAVPEAKALHERIAAALSGIDAERDSYFDHAIVDLRAGRRQKASAAMTALSKIIDEAGDLDAAAAAVAHLAAQWRN